MGMLTAEFPPSSGDATLSGFSIVREPQRIRRRIGYCPQFDAHFANMTGREHVELYAAIKGIPQRQVVAAARKKLAEVGLSEKDSDRVSSNYSGGMKRRLSLACATIGKPSVVFLDECSTGVDPVARREIWQMISDMVAVDENGVSKTSVVLTTHSMEECEALCPRIGIMANGRLRCLGSAQHLKNKFGQGYQIELKANAIDHTDGDFVQNARSLAAFKGTAFGEETAVLDVSLTFNLFEVIGALNRLTSDIYLSSMISETHPQGSNVWRDTSSAAGISLTALATFCTAELRMRNLSSFVTSEFPNNVLRERQDLKVRYEVSNEGLRISEIFSKIESQKQKLRLADYGVSQTSLEQVFNRHAAEAEDRKQGTNDH
jgi:ATP-binding cassette, subfamily A (ABC1), member 3